jgi:MscS family membrane protein
MCLVPVIFSNEIDSYIYAISIFVFFQFFRVFIRKTAYKLVKKTSTNLDDDILEAIKKPIDFLFIIIGINFAVAMLSLDADTISSIDKIIRSGFIIVVFWSIFNILNHLSINIHKITNKFGDKINADFSNFIVKSIRFLILILGLIAVLQEWGYNVSAFIASLGLVGMAFALAAKDTAGNLFGSLVLFTDKPFKIGDWIKTPEVEGTIENIGIRSTKVRTFAQALVSVPNGTLANSAILNWSRMGKRRVKTTLGLTYGTSGKTLENIIAEIKEMLQNNPDIHQSTIHIYFSDFGESSLNIFCYYFTKSTNWAEFMRVRESSYLSIMKIVDNNGSSFAFPTQTLHIENDNIVE